MSLTAVPAYFLARRLLDAGLCARRRGAHGAGPVDALHRDADDGERVLPALRARVLVLVLTLERPTARRQLLLLALVRRRVRDARAGGRALRRRSSSRRCCSALIERDVRRAGSGRSRRSTGSSAAAPCSRSPERSRAGARRCRCSVPIAPRPSSDYSVSEVAHYLLWHVAELDLYLGVIGVAALLAMWLAPRTLSPARARVRRRDAADHRAARGRGRGRSRRRQSGADRGAEHLLRRAVRAHRAARARLARRRRPGGAPHARDRGGDRRRRSRSPCRSHASSTPSAVSDTFGLLPWWWLQDHGIHFGPLRFVALAVGLAAGAAFVFVPRRYALALPSCVGVYFVLASIVVENGRHGIRQASVGALFAGIRVPHPRLDRPAARARRRRLLPLALRGRDAAALGERVLQPQRARRLHGRRPRSRGRRPARDARRRARRRPLVTAARVAPRVRYAVSYVDIAGKPLARDAQLGLDALPCRRAAGRPDARARRLSATRGAAVRSPTAARAAAAAPCPCASAPTSTSSRATRS